MADATQSHADFKGDNLSASMFEIVGDGRSAIGSITAASANLAASTAVFTVDDVGKHILVKSAGPTVTYPTSGSSLWIAEYLETTIAAYVDSTHVTLADAAASTATSVEILWGTDWTTRLQAAIDSASGTNKALRIYEGSYHITDELVISESMTLILHAASFVARTDSVFRVSSSNVKIDGTNRALGGLRQLKETGNVIRIDGELSFVTVTNCRLVSVPRWYDEANLNQGNAISAGAEADADYGVGLEITQNYIESGQNGVAATKQTGLVVSRNRFEVADRTGTQRVTAIDFGDKMGLAHVVLNQCPRFNIERNIMGDSVGISNAVYNKHITSEGFLDDAHGIISENDIEGIFQVEVINNFQPGTQIIKNSILVTVPAALSTGIVLGGSSANALVSGNRVRLAQNADNYRWGIFVAGGSPIDDETLVVGAEISNNVVEAPGVGIYVAFRTQAVTVRGNNIRIVENLGSPAERYGVLLTGGEDSTNCTVESNTIRGAHHGVALQGEHLGAVVRSNKIYSPTGNGVVALDGGGVNAIITANEVWEPGEYGVALTVTAVGPIVLGHNYITDATSGEYLRGAGVEIVPERHQDANIRRAGFGLDPVELVDILDSVVGSDSIRIRGDRYRALALQAYSSGGGSDTACIFTGRAAGGTTASPSAVGSSVETARLEGKIWNGSAWIEIANIAAWGGINGSDPYGEVQIWTRTAGGSMARAAVISQGRIKVAIAFDSADIVSGTGSPEGVITAPVGSQFLRMDGASGSTLYLKETGIGNTGWAAVITGLLYVGSGSPEGVVTATTGKIYLNTAGAVGEILWEKASGSGNTGWVSNGGDIWFPSNSPTNTEFRTNKKIGLNKAVGTGLDLDINGNQNIDGTLKMNALTESRPLKLTSGKLLTAAQIDVNSPNDVIATGFAANDVPVWDSTKFVPVAGVSASFTEITTGPFGDTFVKTVALSGVVPPGLTLTVTTDTALTGFTVATHTSVNGVVNS